MRIRSTRCPTISSGKALAATLALLAPATAAAQDEVSFDRPGIAFATDALHAGGAVWEQGLPDFSSDDAGGESTRQDVLDSRLRLGLGAGLELQLASDSYNWQRGAHAAHGGGDSSIGLKWQLPGGGERFGWALLGTYGVATGKAPFTDGGNSRDLGLSLSWALPREHAAGLYFDYLDGPDGHVWTFSPNYTFHDDGRLAAYVEAGLSTGAEHERVAGGGVTWLWTPRLQLDASFLRGLTGESTDWQAGLGISFQFL